MSFGWIIEDLQVQSAVCDMTGDDKKVKDLARAIAMLKKENGYRLPKMMNFLSIVHPPDPVINTDSIQVQNTAPNTSSAIFGGTTTHISGGTSSSAYGNYANIATGQPSVIPVPCYAPCPSPVAGTLTNIYPGIYPGSCLNYNDNPKPGDEIFAAFTAKDGLTLFCIYTWKEKDNPKELFAYAAGWDPVNVIDGTQKWMPCKKHKHEKLLVVCLNECCPYNK